MNITFPLGSLERKSLIDNVFKEDIKLGSPDDPTKPFMRSERVKRGTIYVKYSFSFQDDYNDIWGYLLDSDMNVYKVSKKYIKNKYVIMPEDCRACGETLKYIEDSLLCDSCGEIKDSKIKFGGDSS